MKSLKTITCSLMLLMLLPIASVMAQATATKDKPAAEAMDHTTVINDYFEAIGSEKAVKAIETLVIKGKIEIEAAGLEGEFTTQQRAPNKVIMVMDLPGVGEQKQGYDGETAWQVSQMTGPQVMEGVQRDQFINSTAISTFSDLDKKYDSVKLGEREEFNGEACNVVVFSKKDQEDSYHYFSVDSKLHIGSKMTQESPMGAMEIVSKIGEYKEVKGVKWAHFTAAELPNGMTLVTKIVSIEPGAEVADSTFDLPEEIKEIK